MKVEQLLQEETYQQYMDRLTSTIKKLGSGVRGTVFPHPKDPNIAVKVVGKDDGYEQYLIWANKNQGNKYVPKIYGINRANVDDGFITVVFFEKLKRITPKAYFDFSYKLHKLAWPNADVPDGFQMRNLEDKEWARIAKNTDDPDLAAFAKFMSRPSVVNDVHGKNIMKRADGQLVIIDPSS